MVCSPTSYVWFIENIKKIIFFLIFGFIMKNMEKKNQI